MTEICFYWYNYYLCNRLFFTCLYKYIYTHTHTMILMISNICSVGLVLVTADTRQEVSRYKQFRLLAVSTLLIILQNTGEDGK